MATEQQVQQMLDMMQQQMAAFTTLQAENARLREQTNEVVHNNTADTQYKAKKPDRPTVNGGIDDREWALFIDSWTRYKTMVNVTELASIRMELRAACSDDVNKLLFEYVGSTVLDVCTEDDLLKHIKAVAVKSVHKEVHQVAFNMMVQNPGESVTNYVARLKAKAFLCDFEVTCTDGAHDVPISISYAEQMVAQRLVAGLSNQEHQRKILAEAPTLVSLSDKVARLHMLETTEQSVTLLHKPSPSEAAFQRSGYKQGKTSSDDDAHSQPRPTCKWCGRTSHPAGKSMDRANYPAKLKEYNRCHKKGHFADVCVKSRTDAAGDQQQPPNDVVGDQPLAAVPSAASMSFSFGAQDFRPGRKRNEET